MHGGRFPAVFFTHPIAYPPHCRGHHWGQGHDKIPKRFSHEFSHVFAYIPNLLDKSSLFAYNKSADSI